MILLFVVGYTFIALEHKVKVDKSAIALLMCGAIWTVFSLWGHDSNISHEMVDHLGDTCEILVFLIGAMTIVDLIDTHGGFNVITDHITTRNKHKLMWLLAIITFFMSAALDNMTRSFARKLAPEVKVNAIAPSLILFNEGDDAEYRQQALNKSLMKTAPGEKEVIDLIDYLLTSCFVTGRSFALDGGRHLR